MYRVFLKILCLVKWPLWELAALICFSIWFNLCPRFSNLKFSLQDMLDSAEMPNTEFVIHNKHYSALYCLRSLTSIRFQLMLGAHPLLCLGFLPTREYQVQFLLLYINISKLLQWQMINLAMVLRFEKLFFCLFFLDLFRLFPRLLDLQRPLII